jgi:ankyrin repeat protein
MQILPIQIKSNLVQNPKRILSSNNNLRNSNPISNDKFEYNNINFKSSEKVAPDAKWKDVLNSGDENRIKEYFSTHDVNKPLSDDYKLLRILHFICIDNNINQLTRLLELPDIDINVKQGNGYTPLHIASNYGYNDIAKLLLEKDDIDLTIRNRFHRTAKDEAIKYGNTEIVKMIEEAENRPIDINKLFAEGNTWPKEKINKFFVSLVVQEKFKQAIEMLEKTPLIDFGKRSLLETVCHTGNVDLITKVFEYKFDKDILTKQIKRIKL